MSEPTQPSLQDALTQARQATQLPINELRALLSQATGIDPIGLIMHNSEPVPSLCLARFEALVERRVQGEPIAYLVGGKEFFSRFFQVNAHALIPRPETEELVERALAHLETCARENLLTRVLDLGCGSGAIGITLALENPILEVTASDIDPHCIALAQANSIRLQAKHMQFIQSDLFETFVNTQVPLFDLIVCNPPYIQKDDVHLTQGDLRFEPRHALTDESDGLEFYRRLAAQSPAHLRSDGALLVEHGHDQQIDVMELFSEAGFSRLKGYADLAGTPRIVMAQL